MNMADLTTWGTFFSGLGTLIIAPAGAALVGYDLRLRRRQLRETQARAHATLVVELSTRVHPRVRKSGFKPEWLLETRVTITNVSSEIWAVPLLYVYARAVHHTTQKEPILTFIEDDFASNLDDCSQLSKPVNIARFNRGMFFVSPDETDNLVRWDILSDDFVKNFPALIVRAEIFSVPEALIGAVIEGAASDQAKASNRRSKWLEFMKQDGGARHNSVIVAPTHRDIPNGPQKGALAFLKPNSADVDEENSAKFRDLLAQMAKAGRQSLVILSQKADGSIGSANRAPRRSPKTLKP